MPCLEPRLEKPRLSHRWSWPPPGLAIGVAFVHDVVDSRIFTASSIFQSPIAAVRAGMGVAMAGCSLWDPVHVPSFEVRPPGPVPQASRPGGSSRRGDPGRMPLLRPYTLPLPPSTPPSPQAHRRPRSRRGLLRPVRRRHRLQPEQRVLRIPRGPSASGCRGRLAGLRESGRTRPWNVAPSASGRPDSTPPLFPPGVSPATGIAPPPPGTRP